LRKGLNNPSLHPLQLHTQRSKNTFRLLNLPLRGETQLLNPPLRRESQLLNLPKLQHHSLLSHRDQSSSPSTLAPTVLPPCHNGTLLALIFVLICHNIVVTVPPPPITASNHKQCQRLLTKDRSRGMIPGAVPFSGLSPLTTTTQLNSLIFTPDHKLTQTSPPKKSYPCTTPTKQV
jgi:hypothetical protein